MEQPTCQEPVCKCDAALAVQTSHSLSTSAVLAPGDAASQRHSSRVVQRHNCATCTACSTNRHEANDCINCNPGTSIHRLLRPAFEPTSPANAPLQPCILCGRQWPGSLSNPSLLGSNGGSQAAGHRLPTTLLRPASPLTALAPCSGPCCRRTAAHATYGTACHTRAVGDTRQLLSSSRW